MVKYTEGLTEEQIEKYLLVKDLCLKAYPDVINNKIQLELSEQLWRYYALNDKVPEPRERGEPEEKITEYRTPADIESTLNKVDDVDIKNLVLEDVDNLPDNFIEG